jgi:hypothetical protein
MNITCDLRLSASMTTSVIGGAAFLTLTARLWKTWLILTSALSEFFQWVSMVVTDLTGLRPWIHV